MNTIGLQYAEIAITLLLLITNIRKNRIGSHETNLYMGIVFIAFLSACFDLGSIILIKNQEAVSPLFLYFVCRFYIVTLMWIAVIGFLYLISASKYSKFPKIMWGTVCLALIGTVIIFFTPIYLNVDPVFSYGPAASATYFFTVVFILLMVIALLRNRHRFSRRRILFTSIWIGLWVGSAVIQFLNPELLIVGFASGLGLMILYFELENPDSYIDRDTGLYNQYSLSIIEDQWRREEIRFGRTDLFLQTDRWNVSADQVDAMIVKIASLLKKAKCKKVFHRSQCVFTIVDQNEYHIAKTIELVKKEIEKIQEKESGIRMQMIMLENSLLAETGADIDNLFNYYEANLVDEILKIDEAAIAVMKNEDETIEEIKSALREDRIEVFYQPIWSVKEEKFKSAEALVRIRAVDGTIIPPGKFIPVAEKSGLIDAIGHVVLDKTCEMISKDDTMKLGIKYIEVNLSVEQCEDPELNNKIMKTMRHHEVQPEQLNLEITESAEIKNRQILSKNMGLLADTGIAFSLDDFGTGQSNLDYIISMPVNIVKFDMTIIRAYFKQDRAKRIVTNITRMVHEMDMQVVCEGVEEKWQLDELVAMGADYIQGYYYSKPLPKEEFLEYIARENGVTGRF